jgi:four helix bundle protein
MSIKSIKDLKVYTEAFSLAMEIFQITRHFPDFEKYSLTSQIVRSSRSVAANIREGYAKKIYEQVFIRHLIDALGSCEETRCWLDFAYQCKYLEKDLYDNLVNKYASLSAMLFNLQKNWKKLQ